MISALVLHLLVWLAVGIGDARLTDVRHGARGETVAAVHSEGPPLTAQVDASGSVALEAHEATETPSHSHASVPVVLASAACAVSPACTDHVPRAVARRLPYPNGPPIS